MRAGVEAADNLQDAHLVQAARLDVAPALRAVAAAPSCRRSASQAGQHARLDARRGEVAQDSVGRSTALRMAEMPWRRATASTERPTAGRNPRCRCVSRWSIVIPAARTRATCASSSRSTSSGTMRRLAQAAMKSGRSGGSDRRAPAATAPRRVGHRRSLHQRQVHTHPQPRRFRQERTRAVEVSDVPQQGRTGHDPVAVRAQDSARDRLRHPEVIRIHHQANLRCVQFGCQSEILDGA